MADTVRRLSNASIVSDEDEYFSAESQCPSDDEDTERPSEPSASGQTFDRNDRQQSPEPAPPTGEPRKGRDPLEQSVLPQSVPLPVRTHIVMFLTEDDFVDLRRRIYDLQRIGPQFQCTIAFDEYRTRTHHVVVYGGCDKRRKQCVQTIQQELLGYRIEPSWR